MRPAAEGEVVFTCRGSYALSAGLIQINSSIYQTCKDSIWGAINDKIHIPGPELDNEFITLKV